MPLPQPVPLPAQPPVLTLQEFVRTFVPCPGTHHVWILHPRTGVPKEISFTLPAGRPKVHSGKLYVEFDYGKYEASIRFRLSGRVTVEY